MRRNRLAIGFGKGLAVAAILTWSLVPIVFIVISSLKPTQDIFAIPPKLAFAPTFDHYANLWNQWGDFFHGLKNSFIITAGTTVLVVIASAMAGFAYSRFRSRFLSGTAQSLIAIRLIPPIVITLPLFPIINWLALNDTHVFLVILYATFFVSLGTLLMRTFIDQIPRELDEAALIDGAGRFTILWRVIMPLAAPGAVAIAVFVIVFAWNEFLFAFIFTSTQAKTAPLVISEMIGSFDGVDWGVLFAGSTVQLLPILIFIVLTQKHLVTGLTAGATKG